MQENLGEQLTIDDMARTAMFSKFHFSRLFQRVTGVSPGRFLSAMRLQAAKQLLVETSLTVTEISHRVGYTSVGTFSSRFTMSVGVSPTTYRQLGGFPEPRTPLGTVPPSARVRGVVESAAPGPLGLIFLGLYAEPVPRGHPVSATVLHRTGPYVLEKVPQGTWFVLAHSRATARPAGGPAGPEGPAGPTGLPAPEPDADRTFCLSTHGPVRVGPGTSVVEADLRLRPVRPTDPPVRQALLDVQSVGLTVGAA
jgi:AraC-like DNA-binding protein